MKKQLAMIACLVVLGGSCAFAGDDDALPPLPECGFFCKVGRHLSSRVELPEAYTRLDPYVPNRVSTSEEDARPPNVHALVTVHGDIISKSPAQRARERKQAAALSERIDALRLGTPSPLPNSMTSNTIAVPTSEE